MWKIRENYRNGSITRRDEYEIFEHSVTDHPRGQSNVSWNENINEWKPTIITDFSLINLKDFHCYKWSSLAWRLVVTGKY